MVKQHLLTPYKDISREEFVKAVHLHLQNLHSTQPAGMKPHEIIAALLAKGLNQAAIARAIHVTPGAVSRAIHDLSVQSRVMEAIAEAIDTDIAEIWPQHFWNKTPKPGRKVIVWHRKAA